MKWRCNRRQIIQVWFDHGSCGTACGRVAVIVGGATAAVVIASVAGGN
jgi:hypothetical protein